MIKTNQTSAPKFPGQRVRVAERERKYVRDLSERRERAYDYLDACVDRVVAASAIVDKRIGNGDVWGVHRAQVAEHMRVREYLRAEAAVENLPAVPRSPAALRPVDPETLRVPFPASRVYPVLATCTSPRRRATLAKRMDEAGARAADRVMLRPWPSASEMGVYAADGRSAARLQQINARQAEASTISTGQAVITT